MRKQTKIAAMVSAAALLTIGAAMTSFAAGWSREGEDWVYLDRYGDKVTNEWKKSGDYWFYLGDDGYVVTSQLLRDTGSNNEIYYVNSGGQKVTDEWRGLSNEDGEFVLSDGTEPSTVWYYFDSDGKAFKAGAGKQYVTKSVKKSNTSSEKATFVFDEQGHMMTGWVEIPTDSPSAKEGVYVYYLGEEGEEDEGAARTGWQYIEDVDEFVSDDPYEDSNWYWFSSTGKCAEPDSTKYIDGQYYSFNGDRQMDKGWFAFTSPDQPTNGDAGKVGNTKSDGHMSTGWVKKAEVDTDDEYWYYLINERDENNRVRATVPFFRNGAGALDSDEYSYAARSIGNKIYLFNRNGQMQIGIATGEDSVSDVDGFTGAYVYASNNSVMKDPSDNSAPYKLDPAKIYYFNRTANSSEGQMAKNARVTVNIDGETYYYHFDKEGAAYTEAIVNGILYDETGKRQQPDTGWMTYKAGGYVYYKSATTPYRLAEGSEIAVNASGHVRMSDGATVRIDGADYKITWNVTGEPTKDADGKVVPGTVEAAVTAK